MWESRICTELDMNILDSEPYENVESINLNYEGGIQDKPWPMTTVLGIKSSDGIIFASDTQATSTYTKDTGTSKIFRINESIGIGLAGTVRHIKLLRQAIQERFESTVFKTDSEFTKALDEIICELYYKNRVQRAEKLGIPQTDRLFYVEAIVCARLQDGANLLYRLEANPLPFVELVNDYDYEAIGTGESYAKLLMRQHSRTHLSGLSAMDVNNNKWSAVVTINEIKTFDPFSGGSTQLGILDKEDFRILSSKEVREYYNNERDRIAKDTVEKQGRFGITYERIYSYFPDI